VPQQPGGGDEASNGGGNGSADSRGGENSSIDGRFASGTAWSAMPGEDSGG